MSSLFYPIHPARIQFKMSISLDFRRFFRYHMFAEL